jgi:hypothetical protein
MNLTPRQMVYGALAIIGLVATWYFNLAFMEESGGSFSIVDFVEACYANSASASISNDITVAVIAFLVWSFYESNRLEMRNWWAYVVLTFAVAFAFSYPLFLLMRERRLQALADSGAAG